MSRLPGVEVLKAGELHARSLRCGDAEFHLQTWSGTRLELTPGATHLGFASHGRTEITAAAGRFTLAAQMYFAVPGACTIAGAVSGSRDLEMPSACDDASRGFVLSWIGGSGLLHIGGPIEAEGRLRYLDGCSDTLLIPPTLRGDPCLNFLYIRPGTHQTEHTHPSFRVGIVASGGGVCRTRRGDLALEPGSLFLIPPDAPHCFLTAAEALRIVAFHPDSDFGPADEDHPMWNRTILPSGALRRLQGPAS